MNDTQIERIYAGTYCVSFLPSQRKYALALRTLLREKKAESGRLAKAQLEALKSL